MPNEWTIMFFTASDNELSLYNVSQLKALKEAGFQEDVEVLAYADSAENGVPTRLFNINSKVKTAECPTAIGDGNDPYVRNFVPDEILSSDLEKLPGKCTQALANSLTKPYEMKVSASLENFLGYCAEHHQAKHYLLFCMGHGQIVANDTFLFDENPRSGITLKRLGRIMQNFSKKIGGHGVFELMCLHSCSMSALEVAYELKGTARYMIASEGYSYVGAWPYRQLLKKIFNTAERQKHPEAHTREEARGREDEARRREEVRAQDPDAPVKELVERIYELSLYNATDFAFCGYSHDLTLCSLEENKLTKLRDALRPLIEKLKQAVDKNSGYQDLIQLAHLKSQSFWQEDYTDIYDFCRCLKERCEQGKCCKQGDPFLEELAKDCEEVMNQLQPQRNPFDGLVVFSDNFGWEYQYAHGLSIYFPWTPPLGDVQAGRIKKYHKYQLTKDLGDDHSWLSFLEKYWTETMRPRENVDQSRDFNSIMDSRYLPAAYGSISNLPSGLLDKTGGRVGQSCACPSLKNYPFNINLRRRVWTGTKRIDQVLKERPAPQRHEQED